MALEQSQIKVVKGDIPDACLVVWEMVEKDNCYLESVEVDHGDEYSRGTKS